MRNKSLEEKFHHGCELLEADKIGESETEFSAALELVDKPARKAPIFYNLALCQYKKGDRKTTLEFLDKAMSAGKELRGLIYRAKEFPVLQHEPEFLALLRKYPLSNIWLALYTFIRIPLVLLVLIHADVAFVEHRVLGLAVHITCFIFYVCLFIGLIKRRRWAWYMVWVALFLDVMNFVLPAFYAAVLFSGKRPPPADVVMPLVVSLVFWMWPNYVYFMKRKNLFVR